MHLNEMPFVPRQEMGLMHHAVLFGLFARNSIEIAGDCGRDAIRAAVQTYGLERGRRMAQRTWADGVDPSMMSFLAYGEWKDSEGRMVVEDAAMTPVYQTKVKTCAWHEAWKQYGLTEFGHLYCEQIDCSLVEGYLGKTPLQINSVLTLHDTCCHFVWNGFDRTPDNDRAFRNLKEKVATRHVRGFDYHTAHLYFTFSRMLKARLGTLGERIIQCTADDFISLFTGELFNHLLSLQNVDFN